MQFAIRLRFVPSTCEPHSVLPNGSCYHIYSTNSTLISTGPVVSVMLVRPGVISALYAGIDTPPRWHFGYHCKQHLDLDLSPRYFEILIEHTGGEPRHGPCRGKPTL